MHRSKVVRALLVGGPMYDPLYERLPAFEKASGLKVDVVGRLPHPALNARLRESLASPRHDLDLVSTHTKYAPSQAAWLAPLDKLLDKEDVADLSPRAAELSRVDGKLLQYPRLLDCRLLYYRTDLFESPQTREAYEKLYRRALRLPQTWDELVDVSTYLTRPGLHGFVFPGRDSGLFGTWYELLVAAGGDLFTRDLQPAFDSPAGVYAADRLAELHHRRRVTPSDLPRWHYDEVSAAYRQGLAALVCDWPGSHYLYTNPQTSTVSDRTGLALLPSGFGGRRAAYAGCHSWAIPKKAPNPKGAAALLRFLTSLDSQLDEAERGAIPTRESAFNRIRNLKALEPAEAHRWDLLATTMNEALIIPPRFAAYPACEDAIWQAIQKAMIGILPASQAIREAAAAVAGIVRVFQAKKKPKKKKK